MRIREKVSVSKTAYPRSEIVEQNTEAVTVTDAERNLVVEITPYRSMGLAQVATMTVNQWKRIADYSRKQSSLLRELQRSELLLDLTFVPERNWNATTLARIPAGSAVFPIIELKTVPMSSVKHYLM